MNRDYEPYPQVGPNALPQAAVESMSDMSKSKLVPVKMV